MFYVYTNSVLLMNSKCVMFYIYKERLLSSRMTVTDGFNGKSIRFITPLGEVLLMSLEMFCILVARSILESWNNLMETLSYSSIYGVSGCNKVSQIMSQRVRKGQILFLYS